MPWKPKINIEATINPLINRYHTIMPQAPKSNELYLFGLQPQLTTIWHILGVASLTDFDNS
jgi:hypothetical protein